MFDTATPVALVILGLTLFVSFIAFGKYNFRQRLMLNPHAVVRGQSPWLLVTYGFVHADPAHLLFNMVSFYSIAFPLERMLGSLQFGLVYFGSLLLGTLPTVWRNRNNSSYRALGASGAVSGLLFSAMLFFPDGDIFLFLIPVGIPFPVFAVAFLVVSWIGSRRSSSSIGHEVHLYGALAGLALTIIIQPRSVELFYLTLIQ